MNPPAHGRCFEHGLASGPDGRCVLCRRASTAGGTRFAERLTLVALGMLAAGVAGAVAYKRAGALPPPAVAVAEPSVDDSPEPPPRADAHDRSPRPVQRPAPSPSPRPRPAAAAPTANQEEAAAAQRERQRELGTAMHGVSIRMYTTAWCPRCTEAKAWLAANRYAYTELDVEANDGNRRAHRALNARGSVPTIDVEGEVLVGFGAGSLQGAIRRAAERRAQRD